MKTTYADNRPVANLLCRPEKSWSDVLACVPQLAQLPEDVVRQVTYDVKYAGYLARENSELQRQQRWGKRRIPESFDYASVQHLRVEAQERLSQIRPVDLAVGPVSLAAIRARTNST